MKYFRFPLAIACTLLVGEHLVYAQSITPDRSGNPDQVEQLGYPTQYAVTGDTTGRGYNVTWYGRQTDSTNPQDFSSNPNGGNFRFRNPGSFEIKAVIKYQTVSRPNDVAPPDKTLIYPVTIPPPTVAQVIVSGQAGPWASASSNCPPPADSQPTGANQMGGIPGQWCYFALKSKSKLIGPDNTLGAQELITQRSYMGANQPDGVWRPNNANATDKRDQGSDSNFGLAYLQNLQVVIADFKCQKAPQAPPSPGAPLAPVNNYQGNVVFYKQENRVFWIDNSGIMVYGASIGTKYWSVDGNGDGTWTPTPSDPPPPTP